MFSFFDFNGDGELGIFERACRDAVIFSTLFDNDNDDADGIMDLETMRKQIQSQMDDDHILIIRF